MLTFDLPNLPWGDHDMNNDTSFDPTQAELMSTGDPNAWELTDFQNSGLLRSLNNIEVSAGQAGSSSSSLDEALFAQITSILEASNGTFGGDIFDQSGDPTQYFNFPEDDDRIQSQDPQSSQQTQSTVNMDFLSLNLAAFASSTIAPSQLVLPPLVASAASSSSATPSPPIAQTMYVPPAGAGNTSTRRVGGSWKPPVALMQSPAVAPARLQSWSVPTS